MADDEKTVQFESAYVQAGYTNVPNRVARSEKLSLAAKHTYTVLRSYAWQTEECYPGQERLVKEIGVSERGLRRATRELQDVGLVRVIQRGLGKTNRYILPDMAVREAALTGPDRPGWPPNKTHLNKSSIEKEKVSSEAGKEQPPSRERARPVPVPLEVSGEQRETLDTVVTALSRVAHHKGGAQPDPGRVWKVIEGHPTKDATGEAAVFEDWWLHGKGQNRSLRAVVTAYSKWMKSAEPAKLGTRTPRLSNAEQVERNILALKELSGDPTPHGIGLNVLRERGQDLQ